MKTPPLSLATFAGIFSILFASSYVGFSTAESTSILDSGIPPIMLTQVELWGPSSFHTDGIKACEDNETSLGPWAVGWVELHNTQNDSITINDVDLKGKGWEEGQFPMTLGPQEYCYIVTQNQLSTRIGVGGSLGNGPPPHDNAITTLTYSVQSFDKKMNYTDSTPPLSDDVGDTKTWQLVDSNWIFQDADFKQELSAKITMLPPLKQFRSGVSTNDIVCKEGLYLAIKSHNQEPACLKAGTISKLASRGFLYGINVSETNYTTILIPPGSENPSSTNTYSPDVATVVLGVNNTVRWVSQSESANTIVPDMPLQQDGKSFGSNGVIKPGDSYQFTFTEPGTFAYHTEPHPWMKGRIIVLQQSDNTDILATKTFNVKQIHYYGSSNLHPKVSLYDYSYDGIDKDGLVSINNQTFYQTTLDNDIYKLEGVSVQFHNVTFSFPEGTLATPGGAFVNLDVKFQDGSEEIYGGTMSSPDGSSMEGGISIPTQYGPHLATKSITVLGNHTMPEAGLTIYHDKIKLLVNTDNQDSSVLKLSLVTNSTTIQSGQAIGIDISLNNTSFKPLIFSSQDNWPINGLGLGGCSFLPVGIAIVDGYYTEHNMTDAKPLSLYFLPPCPPALGIKSFTFQPMSDQITVECKPADFPAPCPPMVKVRANVAYSSFLENQHFLNFNTGVYTVMGGDEWGHIAIRHFVVTNSTKG